MTKGPTILLAAVLAAAAGASGTAAAADARHVRWRHLSTKTGDLQAPNAGDRQTSLAVADFDGDGVNDFVVTERTKAPSVLLYRRTKAGWDRSVVDATPQHIEAGSIACDIDGDGDQDLLVGGDWMSNLVWWYENPSPKLEPGMPWAKHVVKDWGATKHHDQIFGDSDGDGHLDIWVAEMRPNGENPGAKSQILFGDGQGGFEPVLVSEGFGLHESEIADLDGDGDLDVLGKPYNWDAPRLDVWINEGPEG